MAQLTLRSVKSSDLLAITKINAAVQQNPWSPQGLKAEFDVLQLRGLVVEIDSKICGYLLCRFDDQTTVLEVMTLGISEEFQRQGLAEKLLTQIFKDLNPGIVLLEVSAKNAAAISLYNKLGFEQTSARKAYYSDGSDALLYKLNLAKTQ